MAGCFQSLSDYYEFAADVKRGFRFVRTDASERFLRAVAETVESRRLIVPKDQVFWRAQVGCATREQADADSGTYSIPYPYPAERMVPRRHKAKEGRANPTGVPCLYLANEPETAMSEIRPWIGSYISLGAFATQKELKLVDCAKHHESNGLSFHLTRVSFKDAAEREPTLQELQEAVWASIDHAFADPVTRNDDVADYLPTQMLAELFRSLEFDGVVYKSRLRNRGYNIAVFEINAAQIIGCQVHEVRGISYDFSEEYESKWGKAFRKKENEQSVPRSSASPSAL